MENHGEWSCDANDAVQIAIVQPGETEPKTLSTFHPIFTYPIFGDEEQIFGYKGLIIRLRFAAHDLRSHVHISYDDKFRSVGDIAATDLNKTLREWMPETAFASLNDYKNTVQNDPDAKDFRPPGKLVHAYTSKGRSYEIWAGSLADADIRNLLNRAQIFISFFIEAGTPIVTDDPEWTLERWNVYFVYEKVAPPTPTASQYSIVGYATTYRWWFFPKPSTDRSAVDDRPFPFSEVIRYAELPSRLRIAQFLILPAHQGSGHGTHLYKTIQNAVIADPTVTELTIEDPNEAFDVLRDTADFHLLHPEFLKQNVTINPDPYPADRKTKRRPRLVPTASLIPLSTLQSIRSSFKIASTQFAHILEMSLLSQIPPRHRVSGGANMARLLIKKHNADNEHDRRYYWWRMLVKQRLYKRSRDILIQLELPDRIQKLEETLANVEEGYELLLKGFEKKRRSGSGLGLEDDNEEVIDPKKAAMAEGVANGSDVISAGPSGTGIERTKRKFTIMDDEDEDEEARSERSEDSKRMRL